MMARVSICSRKLPSLFTCIHHPHLLTRQLSMGANDVAARLNSSGFLRTQGFIGGKWVDAYAGKTIQVNNPATGEIIANVACMGNRETNDAIASAYDAFKTWSKFTAAERSKCLRKWYDLIIANKEQLGELITLEQGKPLKEAIGEVTYGASFLEFFAEEAKRVYGDIIPSTLADRRLFVLKQPVGVVGAITPWNFPLAMITRKVGPALAAGCTVVIKPSEFTPLTALAAAELAQQAGIPPGAVNVVMGNAPEIGDALLASPQVRKITFTGSTAVGKKLMAGAAGTVKKVSLELGGNAPCIIFDDADLEVAIKGTLGTKFRNSGQTCVCANRILVQEGIYDKFASALSDAVNNLKVGDGFGEGVVQGPLINEAAVQKVETLLQDAVSKGAKVLLGGKRHGLGLTFFEPTVISDVNNEMRISREEVFGPVAPLLRFMKKTLKLKMPLKVLEATISTFDGVFDKFKSEAPKNKANFILFLADIDPSTSQSWCPDCVRAEPVIYKKLEASSDDVALLRAYVGDRPTWRNPQHPLRIDSQFKLKGVPTLILWENDAIKGRLEDHEAHVERKIDTLLGN